VRKLLYVEDNEDNVYMLQLCFDVLGGYEMILSATDGAAGLAMAATDRLLAKVEHALAAKDRPA